MAEVTTTTEPNLYQLAVELGDAALGFRMVGPDDEGRYVVRTDGVQQAALEAAVSAHVPDPQVVPPSKVQETQRVTNRGIVDQRITLAIAQLQTLIDYPAVPAIPNGGTLTTAQLSTAVRALRDEAQATRAGAQKVASTLRDLIRLVRGDFDDID